MVNGVVVGLFTVFSGFLSSQEANNYPMPYKHTLNCAIFISQWRKIGLVAGDGNWE